MDYLKMFEEYLHEQDKSKNTIDSYMRDLTDFYNWYKDKNNCELTDIIGLDTQEYKKILENQYKAATVNRKIATLNKFLGWMKDNRYITKDIKLKQIKNSDNVKFKGLEEKQLWQFRKEIHRMGNLLHICIIEILMNTGIRVSELCNIQLQDIEITERKGILKVTGKGNKQREIPLNKDVREAITNYLEVRKAKNDDYYLLQGQRGAMTRKAIDIILKQYGSRLNIDISAHAFRHTLAYKLVTNKDISITTIQAILGHEKLETTMIYTQTLNKDKEKALENIEW